jgi:hypothetical protein
MRDEIDADRLTLGSVTEVIDGIEHRRILSKEEWKSSYSWLFPEHDENGLEISARIQAMTRIKK